MRILRLILTNVVLLVAAMPAIGAEEPRPALSTYRPISALDLRNAIATRERPMTIVDVGGVQRWSEAHIPGSTPLDTFANKFNVSPGDWVVIYNNGFGSRYARESAQRFAAEGYKDVAVLSGGLAEWEGAGYAVKHDAPAQEYMPLNGNDLQSAITLKDTFVLLDVRSADRFNDQRIVGAIQASAAAPTKSLVGINKADWIVVYDAGDGLAEIAVRELRARGFKRALVLGGGLSGFVAAGGLTERGPPAVTPPGSERQTATPSAQTKGAPKPTKTRPAKKEQSKPGREGAR